MPTSAALASTSARSPSSSLPSQEQASGSARWPAKVTFQVVCCSASGNKLVSSSEKVSVEGIGHSVSFLAAVPVAG